MKYGKHYKIVSNEKKKSVRNKNVSQSNIKNNNKNKPKVRIKVSTKTINPVTWIIRIVTILIILLCMFNINGIISYFTNMTTSTNEFSIEANYIVTFDSNSGTGTMQPQEISYNVPTNLTANSYTKTGYTFNNWNTNPNGDDTTFTDGQSVNNLNDITLYAQWNMETYNIGYTLNNGSVATANPDTYNVETASFTLNNPSKTGYTFKGWSGTGLTGDTNTSVTITQGSTGDRSYTANWIPNTYTVVYNKKSLPSGYQEVEYIESHGSQYIDTGVKPSNTLTTDLVYRDVAAHGSNYVLGSRKGVINTSIHYGLVGNSSDLSIRPFFDSLDGNDGPIFEITRSPNKMYHAVLSIEHDSTQGYRMHAVLDDLDNDNTYEKYTNYSAAGINFDIPNIYVCAIKPDNIHEGMRVYSLKFWEDDVMIRDFVPCYRSSDNAVGLYDLVTQEFYTHSGFTHGSNASTATSSVIQESQIMTYDVSDNLLSTGLSKPGYHIEWNTNIDGTGTSYNEGQSVQNLTATNGDTFNLYAQWKVNTYNINFNKNGGSGTMSNQTMTYNIPANLTANNFTRTGYTFTGWNTESNGSGTSYTNGEEVNNLSDTNNATVTLYAQWEPMSTKYAVQIYGINQDVDASGNTLGLTFGPAVGANYNNSYVTHEYEETSEGSGEYYVKIITHTVAANGSETTSSAYLTDSSSNNVTRTGAQVTARENISLHDMTWTEIAAVSDKTVFEDCMLCGDTKSVSLTLNSTLASGSVYNQYGDGAGMLYNTISNNSYYYTRWNPSQSQNSYVGTGVTLDSNETSYGSNARNAGGYSVSHIRATLIGKNAKTNEGYAGDVNLTSDTCLYSCIESDLQAVITPKKIKYVTGTSTSSYTLNDDIADSIWLFSDREMYGTGQYSGNTTEGLGASGDGYNKFGNTESKYYISSYNISNNTNRVAYTEAGSTNGWWLRSPSLDGVYSVWHVDYRGGIYSSTAYNYRGLAFGFCIQ